MIDPDKILFIPSTRRGNGTGHLRRCLDWGGELGIIHIYAPDRGLETDERFVGRDDVVWHDSPSGDWELLVLDNRETDAVPEELNAVPLVALDEAGSLRGRASYTVDIIPGDRPGLPPNLQALSFMNIPERTRRGDGIRKILVSFGGEDPAGLAAALLGALLREGGWSSPWNWHIVSDRIRSSSEGTVRISGSVPELRSIIPGYDLVICSYGLTAFEALASEVPVLLLNPTAYHDRLSRSAGLSFMPGAWKRREASLAREVACFLGAPERVRELGREQFRRYRPGRGSFPEWLKGMTISRDACPACGSGERRAVRRFENKSYFRCGECSMLYMVQFRRKDEIYTEDYFFSEYKSQYGKTYIEDFEGIAAMGRQRLNAMARLGKRRGRLLDIGCAYGPFLREARDAGFQAFGLEIAAEAVDYVNRTFPGICAKQGSIEEPSCEAVFSDPFDVVTFWYVIEHMQRLDEVLPRVFRMLNPGGMLCLATPCGRGISGLKDEEDFLRRSPEDHYSVWTRASARRILRRYGFSRIRFRSTGHHPERFPRLLCLLLPFSLRAGLSRLFGLGDSIEIYATRDKT